MESNVTRNIDADMYHNLRSSNPIKYGEYLCTLHEKGHNQKDIAEQLGTNRQMVGRYQRIGRWDDEVKNYLEANRKHISNTAILNAAMSTKNKEELLEEFKKLVGDPLKQESDERSMGELKTFPTVPAFSELSDKLSLLQQRFESFEAKSGISSETIKTLPTVTAVSELSDKISLLQQRFEGFEAEQELRIVTQEAQQEEWTWVSVFFQLVHPASLLLVICIIGLTSYLIHQGLLFFSVFDSNHASSLSSAVVSEAIPLLSAACLALNKQWFRKVIALVILLATITGLGFFMHASLAERMTKQSGNFTRSNENREIILSTIAALKANMQELPISFITKRESVAEKISREQTKLSEIDATLSRAEVLRSDVNSVSLVYSVWLRVAAMILNAFLVHLFFSRFKRKASI